MEDIGVIRKVVWSYIKTNPGLEFDDLFSEAYIAYLEAKLSYNPAKGKRSTFIYRVVDNRLKSLLSREREREVKEAESEILWLKDPPQTPEQIVIAQERWLEILSILSPEAKAVCSIVINESSIYLPIDKPKQCRGIIINELRKRGWGWNDIWSSFKEIKEVISA